MVSVVAKLRFNDTRIKDRSLITGRESTKQEGGGGGVSSQVTYDR